MVLLFDGIAKSALSGKEKNDYELEKLGAVRNAKGHIPMKIMKKMEASKAKKEREQRRFVSELLWSECVGEDEPHSDRRKEEEEGGSS